MAVAQNSITLSFADPELEHLYLQKYFETMLRQSRIALILGAFLYSIFAILDVWIAPEQRGIIAVIRFGFAVPWFFLVLGVSLTPLYKRHFQLWLVGTAGIAGLGIAAIMAVTEATTSAWFAISLILVIIWSFTLSGLRFIHASVICVILTMIIDGVSLGINHHAWPVFINNNFNIVSALTVSMFAGYTIEWYTRRDFMNTRTIEVERQANERLLLNILPATIAHRLKYQPDPTIADRFESIPILFADLVGFTPLASQLNPIQLVELLNTIFSTFDALTEQYQLEKIKTIGDAYMVVGGLPNPHPDPVVAIADLALAMQAEVQKLGAAHSYPLSLRIGIHVGPVVAGVIGIKKFSYDIWSDAVNTASRMESHGLPGQIQISATTAQQLPAGYDCQPRDPVEIKGKGRMQTYWLRGKHCSTQE